MHINARQETLNHLKNTTKHEDYTINRLEEFRKVINSGEPINNFDRTLFESLVDHITVGGYVDGVPDNDCITIVYSADGNKTNVKDEDTMEILIFDIYEPHLAYIDNGQEIRKVLKDRYTVSVRIPIQWNKERHVSEIQQTALHVNQIL